MIGKTTGKYRILARLGRGSMGTVYRAMDETLRREVAIKVLNTELGDPAARRRFHAEAIAIARLNHPGIAKIFELFEYDGQWLMAMELLPGQTLEALIQRSGPLPAPAAADLAMQALSALEHAHGLGVIHRDLKPANLMVADGRLKITDFGIARVAGSERLTSAGLMMGTPAYMAPEQVLGHDVDARADLFAIGCVLFHMCTAKLPFPGDTPMALVQARLHESPTSARAIQPDLPEWIDQVVRRALARDRDARFPSAAGFRDAIERGLTGRPVPDAPQPHVGAVSEASGIGETMLPGSVPVPSAALNVGETRLQPRAGSGDKGPAMPAATTRMTPRGTARPRLAGILPLAGIAAVVLIGVALWLRPEPAPEPAGPPAAEQAAQPPAQTPPDSPAPPPAAVETGSPTAPPLLPPGAGQKSDPPASPAPDPSTARRGAAPDAPVAFPTVKVLDVTDRRGELADTTLTIGAGRLTLAPTRAGAEPRSFPLTGIQAATFTKDRMPRWEPTLAGPPEDLELPGGSLLQLGRRPVRNWLVVQGQGGFLILVLADADVDPVLTALADRARVKIGRPGTRP